MGKKIKIFNKILILLSVVSCAKLSIYDFRYSYWGLFWFVYLIIICFFGITLINELDKYLENKFKVKNK